MRTVQASKVCRVLIGHSGENEAVRVQFSIEGFEAEFPGGSATLYVQRFGDKDAYPVPVDVDGANAYWTVTSADSAKPGHVRCELQWVVGDAIVKSDIYGFYFLKAIDVGTEPPDEPTKRWTDQFDKKIGDLDKLETDAKNNLVSAINEAASKGGGKKDWLQNDSSAEDYIENRPGGYMTDPVETALWTGELKEMQDAVISAVPAIGDSAVIAIGDEIFTSVVEDGSAMAEGSALFGTITLAELTSGSATEYVMFNALNYEGTPVIIQYATDSYVGKTASVTVSSRMPVKIPEKFLELDNVKDVFWIQFTYDNKNKNYVARRRNGEYAEKEDIDKALSGNKLIVAVARVFGETMSYGLLTERGIYMAGYTVSFYDELRYVQLEWDDGHVWNAAEGGLSFDFNAPLPDGLVGHSGDASQPARRDHQHPERTSIQFISVNRYTSGEEKVVQCGDIEANVPYEIAGLDIPIGETITFSADNIADNNEVTFQWDGLNTVWATTMINGVSTGHKLQLNYNACNDTYILKCSIALKNVSFKYKTVPKQDKDSQKYILAPYTVAPHLTFAAPNGLHKLSVDDAGNIRIDGEIYTKLPAVTADDNGKVLRVVDGTWTAVSIQNANGEEF